MSIALEPAEVLTFKRPLTRTTKELLFVRNQTNEKISFKVKTTAPKLYCVRPNSGFIDAGQTQEVQVMLQPFKDEPPVDQKCRDKFLVQAVRIFDDIKNMELADVWPHVESKAKDRIEQIKLRCEYVTEKVEKRIVDAIPVERTEAPVDPTPPPPPPAAAAAAAATTVETVDTIGLDEMKRMKLELDAYKNELESLRSRPPVEPSTAVARSNGISLPVVLFVALVSFLVSYFLLKSGV